MIKRFEINDDNNRMLAIVIDYTASHLWRSKSLVIFTLQITWFKRVNMWFLTDTQSNHSQSTIKFTKVFRLTFASAAKRRTKVAIIRES